MSNGSDVDYGLHIAECECEIGRNDNAQSNFHRFRGVQRGSERFRRGFEHGTGGWFAGWRIFEEERPGRDCTSGTYEYPTMDAEGCKDEEDEGTREGGSLSSLKPEAVRPYIPP